jgi:hypothetical protein
VGRVLAVRVHAPARRGETVTLDEQIEWLEAHAKELQDAVRAAGFTASNPCFDNDGLGFEVIVWWEGSDKAHARYHAGFEDEGAKFHFSSYGVQGEGGLQDHARFTVPEQWIPAFVAKVQVFRRMIDDARRAALEEAAKKCEDFARKMDANGDTQAAWAGYRCEKLIVELAGEEAAR